MVSKASFMDLLRSVKTLMATYTITIACVAIKNMPKPTTIDHMFYFVGCYPVLSSDS